MPLSGGVLVESSLVRLCQRLFATRELERSAIPDLTDLSERPCLFIHAWMPTPTGFFTAFLYPPRELTPQVCHAAELAHGLTPR